MIMKHEEVKAISLELWSVLVFGLINQSISC